MLVNVAPASSPNSTYALRVLPGSRLIITSTPTWMPVRTP